jgi:hypothetical protein
MLANLDSGISCCKFLSFGSNTLTELSAENIGIAVLRVPEEWILPGERSSLSLKIYDISEGRGCRTMLRCRWSIRENHRGFAVPGTKDKRMNWSQARRLLLSGLENHIGWVDGHGSLALSAPVPHILYSALKDLERMFAYNHVTNLSPTMSVVLDDSTIVIPAPQTVIESDTFLSLVAIIWQWWQQEQGLWSEASENTTLIRIMYVC